MRMTVTTLTLMRLNLIRCTPFKLKISTNTSQTGTQKLRLIDIPKVKITCILRQLY